MQRPSRIWEDRLETLIVSPQLRARFGAAGLEHVQRRYSMRAYRAGYTRSSRGSRACEEAGILARMSLVHVHQILNHYTPREDLDPGFEVLDNSANERPDWFEYWPMRKFLLNEALNEDAYYGFLSPKFRHKTNLTAAAVDEIIDRVGDAPDIFLFSPSIHNSAYFLNVFEHGESQHPGLAAVASRLVARIDPNATLVGLVSDSRNTVHSNYFVAKPRFWRAWLDVNERLFEIAESADDPLGAELRAPTTYRGQGNVQMKIFVMERMASWILSRDDTFTAHARDPFRRAGAHLQAATRGHLRCAQDRLRHPGAPPVSGRVLSRTRSAAFLESADSSRRCSGYR